MARLRLCYLTVLKTKSSICQVFWHLANMIFLRVLIRNSVNSRCCTTITHTRMKSAMASAATNPAADPVIPENLYDQRPGEVYDDRVKNKIVEDNAHQRDVIAQFDHLYDRLHKAEKYMPPPIKKPNIFSQLGFGGSLEEKKTSSIPRGVYVWGTVGGGT